MSESIIELRRGGQGVAIRPPVPELIGLLTADCHVAVDDPNHGVRVQRQKLPLAWPSEWLEEPIIESFAGLEPRLKETLEELGHKVRLAGERPGILPRPQQPGSGGQEPDEAVLEFIRRQRAWDHPLRSGPRSR